MAPGHMRPAEAGRVGERSGQEFMRHIKKEYKKVPIGWLKENSENPKFHDEDLIKRSIGELGYIDDIVCDEHYIILAGHGRLKALKELDYKEVSVIQVTGLSAEEKKKYLLVSNKSVIRGDFSSEKLMAFDEPVLKFAGFDEMFQTKEEREDEEDEKAATGQADVRGSDGRKYFFYFKTVYDMNRVVRFFVKKGRKYSLDTEKLNNLVKMMEESDTSAEDSGPPSA